MSKILLVEDDLDLAKTVAIWFEDEDHIVEHVSDGKDAINRICSASYDAIILDWELPGTSGLEVCRNIRDQGINVPIIMVTGRGEIDSRITGLDVGVDDYLTKPFSLKELAARIRAVIRRSAGSASPVLKAGNIELDPRSHLVTKSGAPIQLMPREFAVLEFFLRHKNQIFSTEALLQRLWHTDSDSSPEAVRACVKRLRKKIDDEGLEDSKSIIETIPKLGYRLNG